jgi:hypothetical protein
MMKTLLLCLITLGLAHSCSTSKKQPETKDAANQVIKFDSLQKTEIEAMVGFINEGLRKVGPPQRLAFPLYNEKDTMLYWIVDNQSARISIEFTKGTEVIWPTFFVYEGDLVFVRNRYVDYDTTDSRAFESLIYLKNGEVVFCDERGKPMQKGDFPGSLMTKAYSKSTRSKQEIEADYKEYWEAVKAHMEKNGVLPDFLKE